MNIYRFGFWLVLVFLFISCETHLKIPKTELPKYLAVNSFITPDSIMRVFVNEVKNMQDGNMKNVTDAVVKITDITNNLEYRLTYDPEGFYRHTGAINHETGYWEDFRIRIGCYLADVKPVAGSNYKLTVAAPDYEHVEAETAIPQKRCIDSLSVLYKIRNNVNERVWWHNFEFEFSDPAEEENWYQFDFCYSNYDVVNNQNCGFYNEKLTEASFENAFQVSSTDPLIISEGTLESGAKTFIFSDELINGTTYTLNAEVAFSYSYFNTKRIPFIFSRSLSKEAYLYTKSIAKHKNEQGLPKQFDWFSPNGTGFNYETSPVALYSNIKGGVGVFAGYNISARNAHVINPVFEE